ncbi:MAG: hypothetical protein R6V05_12855 [Candidatus Brocadiia bacterium]
MTEVTRWIWIAAMAACLCVSAAHGVADDGDVTTVRLTDQVIVEDTIRLGINTCGDNYWDSALTKMRVAENFEGVLYRMISWGPAQDEGGIFLWSKPAQEAWEAMKGKVRYTLLGPPAKYVSGVIEDMTIRRCEADPQKRDLLYVAFDKEVEPPERNKNGILFEYRNPEQGSIRETNNPDFWGSEHNDVSIGDVPPGSFGVAALRLRGAEQKAHYTFVPMWQRVVEQDGTWRVRFWAKAPSGEPTLSVTAENTPTVAINPSDEWQQYDLRMEVEGFPPERDNGIAIRFVAERGDVLVDDVEIWKVEDHGNPTAFRDQFVDLVRELNPGTLRMLQMGGSDLENNLRPRLEQMGWTRRFRNLIKGGRNGASKYEFNLHDYYELCEHVGADPWYCLPGTLYPEEIPKLMEYLGAPADVGYGRRRAELGHPQPWTEVFDHIYVEFGNEAWNPGGYATGSFNGPDHWRDMFAAARRSPHYRPNVVFVAGCQAGSPWLTGRILQDVPNADLYAIAPYLMNGTRAEQVDHLETDDELFRWVYAYTARRVLEPVGRVFRHHQQVRDAGKELAIYEHHFHITHPWPDEGGVPIERRNRVIASIGGGINIINDALLMMRERGIRSVRSTGRDRYRRCSGDRVVD